MKLSDTKIINEVDHLGQRNAYMDEIQGFLPGKDFRQLGIAGDIVRDSIDKSMKFGFTPEEAANALLDITAGRAEV